MSTRPIVAIDARKMVREQTGIGRYISELVKHFPFLETEFEFHLLVDKSPAPGEVRGCRMIHLGRFCRDDGICAKLYSPFWMNVIVSRYLYKTKVDLFHGANFVLPNQAPCPCVSTVHDLAFIRKPEAYSWTYRRYIYAQVRTAIRRADAIIVVSEATKRDLVDLMDVDPERITVIYHGVSEKFAPISDQEYLSAIRTKFGLPGKFLLTVGVVQRRKNIDTLLRAVKPLIDEGLTEAVVLAGREGLGADEVRQTARELGILDRVYFLGYVGDEQLAGLYNLAQCLVFPSWYEGFGLPLLEAMACGCPVVASKVSSIPEVVGDAAVLFPPSDADALTTRLREVLTLERLREEMIRKGHLWAAKFTWREAAARHLDLYRRLLSVVKRG